MKARKTLQKQAIQATFRSSRRPQTAQDVQQAAASGCPGQGVATGCRAAGRLLESGGWAEVKIPRPMIRCARHELPHQHLVQSEQYERVLDVPGSCKPRAGELLLGFEVPRGFQVKRREVPLDGLGADCTF